MLDAIEASCMKIMDAKTWWGSDFAKHTQRDIDNIQRHLNSLRDRKDVSGLAEFRRLDVGRGNTELRSLRMIGVNGVKVSELVLPQINDWDLNKLSRLFVQRDIELITQIPISINFEDKWCWRGDLRGCYTVKQGYRRLSIEYESGVAANGIWRKLWCLKIPLNI
nr:uncharacterized protein LOC109176397 [Ipomoea trifida]